MNKLENIEKAIRDVPDFPKKGILFKDITTMLQKGDLFKEAVDRISSQYASQKVDVVVGIESRGFIFGAPVAYKLGAGLVPIRKKGKLPSKTVSTTYALEYGTGTLEMHQDAFKPGARILVVDDLLATGGTAKATAELIKKIGGKIIGYAFLIELKFLKGRENLNGYEISSLIQY